MRKCYGPRIHPEQVRPRPEWTVHIPDQLHQNPPEAPPNAVADHRRAHPLADREGDPRWLLPFAWSLRGQVRDPNHPGPGSPPVPTQRLEGLTVPDSPDQADSRCRPFKRRALRTFRPARVDIRCRKPCRFARRRLLGWNVRFTSCLLDHRASLGWRRCGNPSGETLRHLGRHPAARPEGHPRVSQRDSPILSARLEPRSREGQPDRGRWPALLLKTPSEQPFRDPGACLVRDRPQGATVAPRTESTRSPLGAAGRSQQGWLTQSRCRPRFPQLWTPLWT